jgi:hypothetical protein
VKQGQVCFRKRLRQFLQNLQNLEPFFKLEETWQP